MRRRRKPADPAGVREESSGLTVTENVADVIPMNGQPVESIYPSLSTYLTAVGGWFLHPVTMFVYHASQIGGPDLPEYVLARPCTVRYGESGRQQVYSAVSWKPGERPLILVRLADGEDYYNPYQSELVESAVRVPKTAPVAARAVMCAACGIWIVALAEPGQRAPKRTPTERAYRGRGWTYTSARGWVCPAHSPKRQRRLKRPQGRYSTSERQFIQAARSATNQP